MTAREECTCIKLPVGGRLPMDDCPVHPPDVAEPRMCNCRMGMTVPHEQTAICTPGPSDVAEIRERLRVWAQQSVAKSQGPQATYVRDVTRLLAEIQRLRSSIVAWKHEEREVWEPMDAENAKLREFFEAVFSDIWDLQGDGFDMQDTAERLGLIVRVPADEQFKDEYDSDEMFVWSWHPLALEGK